MAQRGSVVVKGRFGMGNRIAVMLSALRYAREHDRALHVDWNDHTYYSPHVADVFGALWASPRFEPFEPADFDGAHVFPPEWTGELHNFRNDLDAEIMPYGLAWSKPPDELDEESAMLAEQADVIVLTRDGAKRRFEHLYSELRPSPAIQNRIDRFALDREWSKVIGVQVRHGNGEDYLTPADTDWFFGRIERLGVGAAASPIFLATDSASVVAEFEKRYSDVMHLPKWYPEIGSGPIHHHPNQPDRFDGGVDAIADMWLLARCGHLLICDGGLGRTARHVSRLPPESVDVYPGKIYATVAEKSDWDNPI